MEVESGLWMGVGAGFWDRVEFRDGTQDMFSELGGRVSEWGSGSGSRSSFKVVVGFQNKGRGYDSGRGSRLGSRSSFGMGVGGWVSGSGSGFETQVRVGVEVGVWDGGRGQVSRSGSETRPRPSFRNPTSTPITKPDLETQALS
ncbi:hypothetical protein TIFTF001_013092 [Ficus carica]|uniref:Uncharacterized protein n=1 Tax=Ficus carica TaxID=3494 RepID=A0AA87ZX23_FICCA|nr:hypothetical protein TIFTF001_013092 [Ficus carica]